jgi:hypothetical protein
MAGAKRFEEAIVQKDPRSVGQTHESTASASIPEAGDALQDGPTLPVVHCPEQATLRWECTERLSGQCLNQFLRRRT